MPSRCRRHRRRASSAPAVALELARGGRRVVCVDKGPAPGAGSTSASSSIIRFSYSTIDAVLTSWEAAACWRDWAGHLGVEDPAGMARFVPAGNLVYRTPDYDGAAVLAAWDDVGIPYERPRPARPAAPLPGPRPRPLLPAEADRRPGVRRRRRRRAAAFYNGDSGYIDDPMLAARNLADAAAPTVPRSGFAHRRAPAIRRSRRARHRRRARRRRGRSPRRSSSTSAGRTRRASTRWPA